MTDSCCDLPLSYVENHHDILNVLGMPIHINGTDYIDDLGKTLSHDAFYKLLREGAQPTTSQINSFRFSEAFKKHVERGYEVVYAGFSSGMSGTFNSAQLAKNLVLEEFPEAKIELVDTLSASIGLGALIIEAVEQVKVGASAQAVAEHLEAVKWRAQHWFGVDDLQFLKNGGRISSTSAMLGTMLNVKPTLIVDREGKLKPYSNVRGRKKSISFLASKVHEHYHPEHTKTIVLGHGNCIEDALLLKTTVMEKMPELNIVVTELSMTIASHVGPGMLAIAFIGANREQ